MMTALKILVNPLAMAFIILDNQELSTHLLH